MMICAKKYDDMNKEIKNSNNKYDWCNQANTISFVLA